MTETQMQRDSYGCLPYLSRWARHEPMQITRQHMLGNRDHWARMKHKSVDFSVLGKDGKSFKFPGERSHYELQDKDKAARYSHYIDGSMKNIGTKTFTDWIIQELHGNVPGDHNNRRPKQPTLFRTAANERAKDGFRYWYMEKKPSSFGKSWIGSKGNTLGLTGR